MNREVCGVCWCPYDDDTGSCACTPAVKASCMSLADVLEHKAIHENGTMLEMACAAELRRLHQFAEDQIGRATTAEAALQMTKVTHALKIAAVEAQRDALLKTMKWLDRWMGAKPMTECSEKVRAAIKQAEGEQR